MQDSGCKMLCRIQDKLAFTRPTPTSDCHFGMLAKEQPLELVPLQQGLVESQETMPGHMHPAQVDILVL